MAKLDGVSVGLVAAGSLFLYAGISGRSVPAELQAIIKGQSPKLAAKTQPITGSSSASTGTSSASTGGYVNPFSAVQNLKPNRVDMGVDFDGTGPVAAIGSGTITQIFNFGWPNSTYIGLHLDSGEYAGKYVYFAEDINPAVKTGQHVNAGDTIGVMFNGNSGIECGWAAPPGIGATMAALSLQFYGSNTTAYGASFNKWLTSLGVPSGQINNTPTGKVAAGYP